LFAVRTTEGLRMISTVAPFLAGLGLFFVGIHFLVANLTTLAGRNFRRVFTRMSSNVWRAAAIGILAGVVTQSTNAVTCVAIGLVNGQIIDKRRAILLPTWSHVGASVLVVLVAIDFRVAASYVVALTGFAIYYGFTRTEQSRSAINTLLGVGLLFLGMETLKAGADPLRDLLVQDGAVAFAAGAPWLMLLFGVALTLVCQSSTVAGAIAVAATNISLIDFQGACWMVYGANLGSGANQYLLARGYLGDARQIALMQVLQKLAGFAGLLVILAVSWLLHRPLIDEGVAALADTTAARLAWVFVVYQLIGSTACTLAFEPVLRVLDRMAPSTPLQEMSKPAFLIDEALVDPSLALELLGREESRLVERLPMMLDTIRADVTASNTSPQMLRTASTTITRAMAGYLESIMETNIERVDRERVIRFQHRTANLDALFEALDEFRTAAQAAKHWPASGRLAESMIEALHTLLSAFVDACISCDPAEREFVLSLLGHRDELMERMRQRVLRENPDLPAQAHESVFAATMLFERVVWLARRSTLLLTGAPQP
jgi:phosphate:Na+ symporter